jgi:hypothetical protein
VNSPKRTLQFAVLVHDDVPQNGLIWRGSGHQWRHLYSPPVCDIQPSKQVHPALVVDIFGHFQKLFFLPQINEIISSFQDAMLYCHSNLMGTISGKLNDWAFSTKKMGTSSNVFVQINHFFRILFPCILHQNFVSTCPVVMCFTIHN